MEDKTNFWNKKADDATLGDTVMLVTVISIAPVVIFGAGAAVVAGVEKFNTWRRNRKDQTDTTE